MAYQATELRRFLMSHVEAYLQLIIMILKMVYVEQLLHPLADRDMSVDFILARMLGSLYHSFLVLQNDINQSGGFSIK